MRLSPLLLVTLLAYSCADTTSLSDLKPSVPQIVYPDSDVGFQSFIRELVDAHATGSSVQNRMHSVLIPNDSEWFIKVFGPANGPILDFQYRNQLGWQFSRLYTYLPVYGWCHHLVNIEYSEEGLISPFVTGSELVPFANQRLKIYSATIATNEEGPWLKVGSFVYVEGSFRYLGTPALTPDWHAFYSSYDRPFEP